MERNETGHEPLPRGRPKTIPELKVNESDIERVSDMSSIELEAFMHEPVTIYVHPARGVGELEIQLPNVNGINQPIPRGQEITVKRKYVEVLARCTISRFEQVTNQNRPENNRMIENKVQSYPFDVRRDTAKGKEWLQMIYASI